MDQHARIRHLQDLLSENAGLRQHLGAHANKLRSHHESRERDRNILHATKALRRAEKEQRRLERGLRNERKQHSN